VLRAFAAAHEATGEVERDVYAPLVIAGVVYIAERGAVRESADQVAAAELDPVEFQSAGRVVDEALDHVGGVGPPGAAVGPHRHLVGPAPDDRHLGGGDVVATREQHRGGVRGNRRCRQQVRPEVSPQPGADPEHPPVAIESQLDLALDPPSLVGGEEVLEAVLHPLQRRPELDRRRRDRGDLGRDHPLGAECAADVGHDQVDRVRRAIEDVGELLERAVGVLRGTPHGQQLVARVVLGDASARLDRRRDEGERLPRQPGHGRARFGEVIWPADARDGPDPGLERGGAGGVVGAEADASRAHATEVGIGPTRTSRSGS
jgi:hypothetical protein